MRKLVEVSLHQPHFLDSVFSGLFDDDNENFSDASLYKCSDDDSDSGDGSDDDHYNCYGLESTVVTISEITRKKSEKDDEVEGRRKIKLGSKKIAVGGPCVSDKRPENRLPAKQWTPSKKHRAESINEDGLPEKYSLSISNDSEPKANKQKKTKVNLMTSMDRDADAESGITTTKAPQRRKKLCKAADLAIKNHKNRGDDENHGIVQGELDADVPSSLAKRRKSEKSMSDSDVVPMSANKNNKSNYSTKFTKDQKFKKDESETPEKEQSEKFFPSEDITKHGDQQLVLIDSRSKGDLTCNDQILAVDKNSEEVSSGVTEGGEGHKEIHEEKGDGSSNAEPTVSDAGWVLCDDCQKWRRVPSSVVEAIEATNCGWSCKDNPNKMYAECSVPQEKTNAEINAELNISDVSICEYGDGNEPPVDSKIIDLPQSTWTLIKHNIFQHRSRKTQSIDEQMVCGCVPPDDGSPGCGEDCLNRILNIECNSQTCPCGDACSNQQFQRRLYAKVELFRCGKKGFGLKVEEDVSAGTFIIEYVGEVLEVSAYETRQKDYALRGQKHFYFMTLNSNEVIDACVKGNYGRFINHSCEPNCETQKWMVNGEVCIGLFAIRDLKKGEEITFDYNFVRVCGAVAKKCLCGSCRCRGYIGGDPTTPVSIVESNSVEDDPEPIMLEENPEEGRKTMPSSKIENNAEVAKSVPRSERKRTLMVGKNRETLGGGVKKVKTKSASKKLSSVRLTIDTTGGRFEGVEDKLDELVDENGGLCKGQQLNAEEIAKKYLKLLMETVISSDIVTGEASRSTRDISMILDALLKTQSRAILSAVMNKHGLQALNLTIQRYKKDYKKTPIVRKLLKILDFLAVKRILTSEQLNSPIKTENCVRESIFHLCRHGDPEVQEMARKFRDNWLNWNCSYRPFRNGQETGVEQHDWPSNRQNHNDAVVIDGDINLKNPSEEMNKKRKRHSRWDQPSQEVLDTTLAGGLPKSFWPFNASNLLVGESQQNPVMNQSLRQTEDALADELGVSHPCSTTFSATDIHHPPISSQAKTAQTPVVDGIPILPGSSPGLVPQQSSVFVGIPLGQFLRPPASPVPVTNNAFVRPPDFSYGPTVSKTSYTTDYNSSGDFEGNQLSFGVPPSQFFQQMHRLFGPQFHPWQLQILMAPHAWGPYLSGDARIRGSGSANDTSSFYRSSEGNVRDESVSLTAEADQPFGFEVDPEPPVPGLSPPQTSGLSPLQPPMSASAASRHYVGNERGVPYHQGNALQSRGYRWNAPRWNKFRGSKHRNFGYRRDTGFRKNYRPEFQNQGLPPGHWEDAQQWHHSEGEYNHYAAAYHDDTAQEAGCVTNPIPLERPWKSRQEALIREENNYYNTQYLQTGGDVRTSGGMVNQ